MSERVADAPRPQRRARARRCAAIVQDSDGVAGASPADYGRGARRRSSPCRRSSRFEHRASHPSCQQTKRRMLRGPDAGLTDQGRGGLHRARSGVTPGWSGQSIGDGGRSRGDVRRRPAGRQHRRAHGVRRRRPRAAPPRPPGRPAARRGARGVRGRARRRGPDAGRLRREGLEATTGGPRAARAAHTAPGVLRRYGAGRCAAGTGRVHWAGSETSTFWQGYMDGAVRSGERAADEALTALRRS